MKRHATGFVSVLLLLTPSSPALSEIVAPVRLPCDHPVLLAPAVPTAGVWRKGVERFGESLAANALRLRDYEVVDLKLPGNRGIDLIATKHSAGRELTDVRLVEVKTHHGQNRARLGQTQFGKQMSRSWLANRLRVLRAHGQQGKTLALEISRFRRARGIPLDRLGEVHDLNLRLGTYTIRDPLTMRPRTGVASIERLGWRIARRWNDPPFRIWAFRNLAQYDQLRQARMGHWIQRGLSTRALAQASSSRFVLFEGQQALRAPWRGLARASGRAAFFVAVAIDAHEVYGHVEDYRLGRTSERDLYIGLSRSGGGIAGAWAGGATGAWLGIQLGTLGGPLAWVTVPAGAAVGSTIGGAVGYLGGSFAAEATAEAWYGSLDGKVKFHVDEWIKLTTKPIAD